MNGKYPEKAVLERLEGAMSATLGVLAHWPHMRDSGPNILSLP
jgi:hypothetical protein